MSDLEARKRALAAESDVYRQMLVLEVHNLRVCSARWQRKLSLIRSFRYVLFLLPLLAPLLGFRALRRLRGAGPSRQGWRRWLGMALFAWRMYRKFGPVARTLGVDGLFRRSFRRRREKETPTPRR